MIELLLTTGLICLPFLISFFLLHFFDFQEDTGFRLKRLNHIPRPSGYKIYPYVSYEYPQLAEESQKIEELEAELEVTRPVYFFLGYWPKYPGKTLKRAFFLYNASGVRKELEKKKKEYNVLEKLLVDGEDYNQKFGDRSSQSSGGFYWVA